MLIRIEGSQKLIDTGNLKPIGTGKDGTIFQLGTEALKLNKSGYMTEEKIKDLRKRIPDNNDIRIVTPRKIVIDPSRHEKFRLNTAFGYTQRLIDEIPNGIMIMTSENYLSEMETIKEQIREYFSENNIAITDTNPNNLLPSVQDGKTKIFVIDHDRDVTPSCMYAEKTMIKDGDYTLHNNKRLALLMYKGLLLQLQKLEGLENSDSFALQQYIEREKERKDITFDKIRTTLEEYKTIDEYAKDTIKKIYAKRK